jgi:hypothetical protein
VLECEAASENAFARGMAHGIDENQRFVRPGNGIRFLERELAIATEQQAPGAFDFHALFGGEGGPF